MGEIIGTAKNLAEFDNHKELIRLENKDLGVVGFVAIHSRRGAFPSLGATRIWDYASETEAMRDALRLSRLMSYKSVFADLPYGGAKSTLMISPNKFPPREELFAWYASQLNNLQGRFITGSDVGVEDADVTFMRRHTPFVIGDNVPAPYYTALGVLNGIEVALENLYLSSNLTARTFAVQGLGKTGWELVKLLYGKAGKIFVSDIDAKKVVEINNSFPQVIPVDPDKIYTQKADIFCPCALNYSINSQSAPLLQCLAIVGSANNQMENTDVEKTVHSRGIWYAVDYIVNNGGLISVADQYQHGTHNDSRIKEKLRITKEKLRNISITSAAKAITHAVMADNFVATILYP